MPEGKKKFARKVVRTVYDENTGDAIGKSVMKRTTVLPTGRALYKEVKREPMNNRKGAALSSSSLRKNAKLTSSGIKSKAVRAKSGDDCFKGSKNCGPGK